MENGGESVRVVLTAALLLFSFAAFAQDGDREEAIHGFAKDLASVQAKIQAANANGARIAGVPADRRDESAVLQKNVVVRSEPNDDGDAVGQLSKGSQVEVVTRSGKWSGVLLGSGTSDARVGWVMSENVDAAATAYTQAEYASFAGDVLDTVVSQAQALLDRYRNNPYVRISGFTTEVGMTGVSLSVQFEFK